MTVEPGVGPITLSRSELEQLGLAIRDDYQIPRKDEDAKEGSAIGSILATISESLRRLEGQKNA